MPIINKGTVFKGFAWSAVERFSYQLIQFIIGILLARILTPDDFGIIGMLNIFLAISQSFIDSGFGNALIQKKGRDQTDYSTVFYFNFVVGILVYLVLFFAAPWIASFYDMPILTPVTRVISLNLVLSSLLLVQKTKMTIELNFRIQAYISFVSVILSGTIGVWMAYQGYGVWSLVYQSLVFNLLSCILFWICAKWLPSRVFSISSFKNLFKFGSKLLVTGIYGPIYDNLNTLIIGKFYSPASLGYFTRANTFVQFPSSNIVGIINRVSMPVLSDIQDNDDNLRFAYRRLIKYTYFFVFPLMLGLAIVSKPLIILLLTEKWIGVVPYMQVLCVAMTLYPICAYNINLLLVKGNSGLHLKLDIIKKVVGIIILAVSAAISIMAICYGTILSSLFAWILTAIFSGRLINLDLFTQIKDMFKPFIISVIMVLGVYPFLLFNIPIWLQLTFQIMVGSLVYLIISYIFNHEPLTYFGSIFRKHRQSND